MKVISYPDDYPCIPRPNCFVLIPESEDDRKLLYEISDLPLVARIDDPQIIARARTGRMLMVPLDIHVKQATSRNHTPNYERDLFVYIQSETNNQYNEDDLRKCAFFIRCFPC